MSAQGQPTLDNTDAGDGALSRVDVVQASVPASTVQHTSPRRQRKKLWELPPHIRGSVLSTCLSPSALRKVVAKGTGYDLKGLSDRAVHEEAMRGAAHHNHAGKLLQKTLDRRHETTLQHFHKAQSTDE